MKKRQLLGWLLLGLAVLPGIFSERTPSYEDLEKEVHAPAVFPKEPDKYVALTFDDGPRASTTGKLLDGLRERGASATFFLVGEQISVNRELVLRMKQEGHQVGNHTWSHQCLKEESYSVATEAVQKTDRLLQQLLGEGVYWLRPPYGLLTQEQKSWFTVPLVHWSLDTEDWKLKNVQADIQVVLSRVQPGDIILMHDTVPESVEAALQIVDALQEEGYLFVTVEELLMLEGVTPKAGVLYRSAYVQN